MIISWKGTSTLCAQPEEYDAFPPVARLEMGTAPLQGVPERCAVASYLAFGRWMSGGVILPEPVSALTAERLEEAAAPVRLRPRDVVYAPSALPGGSTTVDVRFELPRAAPQRPMIAVVPSTVATGALQVGETLIVSSNAAALDHMGPGKSGTLRARLAVAVLFAAQLDSATLRLPSDAMDAGDLRSLRRLLSSTNLGLELSPP